MRSFLISVAMLLSIAVAAVVLQQLIDAPNRDAVVVMAMLPAMAFVFFRFRSRVHQYVEFRKQGGGVSFDRWATMSRAERRERVLAARPAGRSARRRARAAASEAVERPAGWVPAPGAHITDDEVADMVADQADQAVDTSN